MAKVTLDPALASISGRIGGFVVKKCNGAFFLSARPHRTAPQTEAQLVHCVRFAEAAKAARQALLNPAERARYEALAKAQKTTAYKLAFREEYARL
jgi:hypothetical protein